MTVADSNFEKKVNDFFGDAAKGEEYMKLTKLEEKIKMIWTAPIIQVDHFHIFVHINLQVCIF